jgi:hypothetical protein
MTLGRCFDTSPSPKSRPAITSLSADLGCGVGFAGGGGLTCGGFANVRTRRKQTCEPSGGIRVLTLGGRSAYPLIRLLRRRAQGSSEGT